MIFIALYAILILTFIFGLVKLPESKINSLLPQQRFSIVIPFRNEAQNLESLLTSIVQLNYNQECFEILLIDDDSNDNSTQIIRDWYVKIPNLKLYQNNRKSHSPKKDAIQTGIKHSKFNWIMTTDADCVLPKNWLHTYNSAIHKQKSLFIAGPIKLDINNSFLHQYQKLDNISLLGATIGSFGIQKPIMCNAANMGFEKNSYIKMATNQPQLASGDDVFTLEYFAKKHPKQTHYLNHPQAIVTTKPENSWKAVVQQRIRWAAKSTHYQNKLTKFIGFVVLCAQIYLLVGFFLNFYLVIYAWLVKLTIDFILLNITAVKTRQKINILNYLSVAFLYPFVNSYVGLRSLFGGYTWKNRKFKR